MDMKILINIIGWIGSFEVLIAYGLNTYQKIRSNSLAFYLLNITGGFFLVIYTIYKEAYASTFVNVIWVLIALPAIYKIIQKKN
jgi:hypothetical protein